MTTWLTTEQAATFLAARGVTVVSRKGRQPPTQQTIKVWCQRGILKQTQRIGGGQRSYYLIAQDELEMFEPPAMGRPQAQGQQLEAAPPVSKVRVGEGAAN